MRQSGFSLPAAIFLLVILSGLAAAMLTFSGTQQLTSAQDLQGSRAYQAARAGIEWGVYRLANSAAANRCDSVSPASFGFSGTTLSEFTVTLGCARSGPYGESANTVSIYTLTATACNRPSSGACPGVAGDMAYVERELQVSLEP